MKTGEFKIVTGSGSGSPGRVAVDNRGRNVWQWNDDQLDSTTIMLQKLDNTALELEPTRNIKRPGTDEPAPPTDSKRIRQRESRERKLGRPERESPFNEGLRDRGERAADTALSIEHTVNVKLGGGFDPYNRS